MGPARFSRHLPACISDGASQAGKDRTYMKRGGTRAVGVLGGRRQDRGVTLVMWTPIVVVP